MESWARWKCRPEIGVRLPVPHEMTRTKTLEPGLEEWACTGCSRRLLLRRPPAFERIVLDRGDERAVHVSGTGGLRIGAVDTRPAHSELSEQACEWLEAHGIEWEP